MSRLLPVCDFNRSFVRWGVDTRLKQPKTVSHPPPFTLNYFRMRAECLAEVTDRQTGQTALYVLSASCKTEQVNVERDIWTQPNADFCMVAGPDRCLNLKRWDRTNKGVMLHPPSLGPQPERQLMNPADSFTFYARDIRRVDGRLMTEVDDIAAVTASDLPMVSRTRIEAKHYSLLLEYPVVNANFSPREKYYQLDTGPVILPDLHAPAADVLATFHLAYVAHARPGWAEFLVSQPTPLTPEISVHHYSHPVRVECHNEMFAVVPG
ncbi:MAG: hypothetical protein JNG83_09325 [Opitutaceae bacterium]|nr:hypothetical protein [Opitutaceae bacterium]